MPSGFNNTPTPASEFHRHSSWGRTRQPKNIAGPHKTMLHNATTTLPTDAPTLVTDGYHTEGQRFLHLVVHNDSNTNSHQLTVWGYTHASGKWATLHDTSGNLIQINHVNQALDHHYIFEFGGVDKLYFQDSGGPTHVFHNTDFIAAAVSTF
jgi:hypothetical protein